MPVGYGQLGCSGFIVSDQNGNAVSLKTRAFLDYGEAAFRSVESILAELLVTSSDQQAPPNKKSKTSTKKGISPTTKVQQPASVGIPSMDEEHRECTDAFNGVLDNPCKETLIELIEILKEHFQHEEELMEKYIGTSTFSPIHSHRTDHERILKIATTELDRLHKLE
eukprot:CAMPEP_0185725274 /NCGR_PEP_ID=MMETSP1171-20130828/1568_1 /TAXON_ID=374046 /ORGANISM="Helicotheca tamensis, Strain CCMP826" /LENGTH=166 /DNA_ID=CAMNT_0028393355 /DNA_START=341 /DNA_END=841 /DNA_ORIENTATION=-